MLPKFFVVVVVVRIGLANKVNIKQISCVISTTF